MVKKGTPYFKNNTIYFDTIILSGRYTSNFTIKSIRDNYIKDKAIGLENLEPNTTYNIYCDFKEKNIFITIDNTCANGFIFRLYSFITDSNGHNIPFIARTTTRGYMVNYIPNKEVE